ncbi:hypothetical protein [Brevibacillus daliensis]|uniref:hypothetical protein n=1 Tax=Brevibacillus daliensis TaxID=2892995 RepID=UPI001E406744|nr:hypothetical protein [Brevibacillus daliensis]
MNRIWISLVICSLLLSGCLKERITKPEVIESTLSQSTSATTSQPASSSSSVNHSWITSTYFEYGSQDFIGKKNSLGLLSGKIYTDSRNKLKWIVWVNKEGKHQVPFTVKATSGPSHSGIEVEAVTGILQLSPNVNTPHFYETISNLSIPHAGLWRLDFYVEDVLLDHIVVHVVEWPEEK